MINKIDDYLEILKKFLSKDLYLALISNIGALKGNDKILISHVIATIIDNNISNEENSDKINHLLFQVCKTFFDTEKINIQNDDTYNN